MKKAISSKAPRPVKTKAQIKRLRRAAKITSNIFRTISKQVKPGVSEIDIAQAIESAIKQKGLKRSFKTIVASGPNAAKPHARLTKRKIKQNDVIVIDFGVIYRGYHSDFTRTMLLGKISPPMRRLYRIVKTAQQMAIKKAKPGLRISDFVSNTHNYMRRKGMGKFILHSLGHGVGRRIHEAPKLSEKNKNILKKNMVLTIEPGLYARGKGGARIEDMVCLQKDSAKVLTR